MPVKRTTSKESAARFNAMYQASPRVRRWRNHPKRRPDERLYLDFGRHTVEECFDCVCARINECHERGVEPDHITNIAWQMLHDALNR